MGWPANMFVFVIFGDLGTQLCYEAPGDLWVKIVEAQWLMLIEWGCPLDNGPKLVVGQPSRSKKSWNNSVSSHEQLPK